MEASFAVPAPISPAPSAPPALTRAAPDDQLVALWLRTHGSPHTRAAYARHLARFRAVVGGPLAAVRLEDLHDFAASLGDLAVASQARTLAAVKSLLAFAQRTGYLPRNVGAAFKLPSVPTRIAERVLFESDVYRLLHGLEDHPRDHAVALLFYGSAIRESELSALTWRDAQPTPDGATGVVMVRGKGDQYRAMRLPSAVWRALVALGRGAPDAPVFASRAGGGHLTRQQVWRLIHRAGERAGLATRTMPHGLRHSHVSHALSRGAPAHLVQATAGHASLATTGRYAHALPADLSGRYLPL